MLVDPLCVKRQSPTSCYRLDPQLQWMEAKRTDALTAEITLLHLRDTEIPAGHRSGTWNILTASTTARIFNPPGKSQLPPFDACGPLSVSEGHWCGTQGSCRTSRTSSRSTPLKMCAGLPDLDSQWRARGPRRILPRNVIRQTPKKPPPRKWKQGLPYCGTQRLPGLPSRSASGTSRRKRRIVRHRKTPIPSL